VIALLNTIVVRRRKKTPAKGDGGAGA
jgi:hypothetical protein